MHRLKTTTLLLAAATLAGFLAGCSAEGRRIRHQENADRYFDAGQYSHAEIEYFNLLKLDKTSAHAIGRLGIIYYENGRLVRAYPYLTKALELDPTNAAVRLRTGYLRLLEGKLREARADALALLDQNPRNEDAPLLLIQTTRTQAESKETRQRLENLLQQTGGTAPLHTALSALRLRENDRAGAEADLQRALASDPKYATTHSLLAACYVANNNLTNAEMELKMAADLAPPRSSRRLEYADFKLQTGAIEEAKGLLAQMTRSVPDYLPAWIKLAQIALAQNQLGDCESLIKQALANDPNNFDALTLHGALLLARRDTDAAITELEQLNNLYTRSPQARYNLALAYCARGDAAKALKCASDAVTYDPNFDDAVLMQAELNLRRDNAAVAIASLTQLLQRRPQQYQAHLLLAGAHVAGKNLDDALATYRRLAEYYPQNPQAQMLIGFILQQQGKNDQARQAFEKSLALAPGYLPALDQLVNLDLTEMKDADALARVQAELKKQPDSPPLLTLLARVLSFQKNTNGAEQALRRALELDVNYEPPYLLLARLYAESGKNAQALAQLNAAVARNPRDVMALMLQGVILNEQQNFAAARDTYEKLLAVNPNSSPALNNLAYLYSEKLNQLDKAYEAARKARELTPYDPYSADTLGWILFKRDEYTWALSLLQESAERLEKEPGILPAQLQEVWFHLGMTYYMLADEPSARKNLGRAAAGPADFPGKNEARRRLELLDLAPQTAGPDAIATLEAKIKEQPDDPVALGRLAAIHIQQGAPEKALKPYELALKQNPKNARMLIRLALLHFEQFHDPQKALALAKDAFKLAPDDADVAGTLGRIAFATGSHKWAVSLLEQSAQKQVATPDLTCDLALAYYSVGRVSDAETSLSGLLQTGAPFGRSNEAKQLVELIALSASPARAAAAEPEIRRILQADPASVPALMALAAAAGHKGDASAAASACEQALKRYPDFTPALKQLALLLADMPGETRAYGLALKAREALPNDPDAAKALGIASYQRGLYREAARLLKETARTETADGRTFYYLGLAQHQLKETQACQEALQKALTLQLPAPLAEEARRVLSGPK